MLYTSTRGGVKNISFSDIVFQNYAEDGGLFVPQYIPHIPRKQLQSWAKLSYPQLCVQILSLFVSDEIRNVLPQICNHAYNSIHFHTESIIPIPKVDKLYLLELFHGKTLAFKDFSLSLVAQIMKYLLSQTHTTSQNANILVHTHGDTGPSAAHAVANTVEVSQGSNASNLKLFILYPYEQCSRIQHEQMARLMHQYPNNIRIYATDKDMDQQREVCKGILADKTFVEKYKMCGMNSINFVRILGQLCYFVYCYLQIEPLAAAEIDVAVPCGAFGNALGCCIAKQMGVPYRNIIACTNEYDIVHRTFNFGDFSVSNKKPETLSPAMDTSIPYNMERYFYLVFDGDTSLVRRIMNEFDDSGKYRFGKDDMVKLRRLVTYSFRVTNENIAKQMIDFIQRYEYLPCPHSACGIYGALEFMKERRNDVKDVGMVCVMTAHPSKFPNIIENVMKDRIDEQSKNIYKQYLDHPFLPNKNDDLDFIELKHSENWKKEWIHRIKTDIVQMNCTHPKQKSKL